MAMAKGTVNLPKEPWEPLHSRPTSVVSTRKPIGENQRLPITFAARPTKLASLLKPGC